MESSQGQLTTTDKLRMIAVGMCRKSTMAKIMMILLLLGTFLAYFFFYAENHVFTWNCPSDSGWGDTEDSSTTTTLSIYFAETSGKKTLDPREACSLESAARHHPNRNVSLFGISQLDPDDIYLRTLQQNLPNLKVSILDQLELFAETPLESWHRDGVVQESSYPVEHLSDAVRLALLYRHGGTYLDTDVICLRPLNFRNAVGLQQRGEVNGAVMSFDSGHAFLLKCMEDYVRHFSRTVWANQGPDLLTRILKQTCRTEFLGEVVRDPRACQGVTVLPENIFYPIPWPEWYKLFQSVANSDIRSAYTVHLWAKLSRSTNFVPGSNSLLDDITRRNCPTVYQLMQATGT